VAYRFFILISFGKSIELNDLNQFHLKNVRWSNYSPMNKRILYRDHFASHCRSEALWGSGNVLADQFVYFRVFYGCCWGVCLPVLFTHRHTDCFCPSRWKSLAEIARREINKVSGATGFIVHYIVIVAWQDIAGGSQCIG
jgi:hypothetical protein